MQRRTVLRSAVKLAYATPLVVATVKFTEKAAFACSPQTVPCGPCETCDDRVGGCVPIPGCIP
jgi:hypothetical protein